MKLARSLHSGFIEIRLDYLDNLSESLTKIQSLISRDVIVTIRKKTEGGKFSGREKRRVELLRTCLSELRPSFMDVELATLEENSSLISELKNRTTRTIVSHHSFQDTPNNSKLAEIFRATPSFAYALKIATKANSFRDNLRILSLYDSEMLQQKAPMKLIAFCMGEIGVYSRIECLASGAPLTFVSLPKEAVAPGQLDFQTMKQALELRN